MDDRTRIAELQAAVDRLTEENAALLDQLMEIVPTPAEWRLTSSEARVILCLARRPQASKSQLMMALYAGRIDDEPDVEIVDVFIHKVRKKLQAFGVSIQTHWGQGYFLDDSSRSIVRNALGLP